MVDFAISILVKISGCLFPVIEQHFGYILNYDSNVESLTRELEDLIAEKTGVEKLVDAGTTGNRDIVIIRRWLTRADKAQSDWDETIHNNTPSPNGCFYGWCHNLKVRYIKSRDASKIIVDIVDIRKLLLEKENFRDVSISKEARESGTLKKEQLSQGSCSYTNQPLHERKDWVENRSNNNCFMIYAKQLTIEWVHDPQYWRWSDTNETSDQIVSVAELREVYFLDVRGRFQMEKLSPGILYKIAFVVMMNNSADGWENPVKLRFVLPDGTSDEHEESLIDLPKGQWIEILVGKVMTSKENSGYLRFFLSETDCEVRKRGLLIKGVTIQPIIGEL